MMFRRRTPVYLWPLKRRNAETERVVFTISGLLNPERSEVRKMALDMGAEYMPSWSSDSTLLIAAFAYTPSFNQVKAVGGTIVHKDWFVECYKRKELIPIEEYMEHGGNPWRAGQDVDEPFLIGERSLQVRPNRLKPTRQKLLQMTRKSCSQRLQWITGPR